MGELFYRGARLGPLHVTTETGDLNGDVIEVEKSDMKCFICGLATAALDDFGQCLDADACTTRFNDAQSDDLPWDVQDVQPEPMATLPATFESAEPTFIESFNAAYYALQTARTDFEILQVRDQAKAVEAAAAILDRRDIQVDASILVATAERAIVVANPPLPPEEAGKVRHDSDSTEKPPVSSSNLRQMRMAHQNLDDEAFATVIESAREKIEPLTRTALIRAAKKEDSKPNGDAPRPPTRTEQMQAKIDLLEEERQALAAERDDLQSQLAFLVIDSEDERLKAFGAANAQIHALKAENAELYQKISDLTGAHNGALRRLRQIEKEGEVA